MKKVNQLSKTFKISTVSMVLLGIFKFSAVQSSGVFDCDYIEDIKSSHPIKYNMSTESLLNALKEPKIRDAVTENPNHRFYVKLPNENERLVDSNYAAKYFHDIINSDKITHLTLEGKLVPIISYFHQPEQIKVMKNESVEGLILLTSMKLRNRLTCNLAIYGLIRAYDQNGICESLKRKMACHLFHAWSTKTTKLITDEKAKEYSYYANSSYLVTQGQKNCLDEVFSIPNVAIPLTEEVVTASIAPTDVMIIEG